MSKTPPKPESHRTEMETIQTRHKTAQQTRQLRKMDRSMKKLTQLLKSPASRAGNVKLPLKKITNENNSTKKVGTPARSSIDVDFHPNKTKRNTTAEKIKLKPKHEMKIIGHTNKRKLGIPQKGMKSPPFKRAKIARDRKISSSDHNLKKQVYNNQSAMYSELSMGEIVRIMEDTQSLNDEDLMEILTCPSPVWWEDPPDASFTEDAICTRSASPSPIIKQEYIGDDVEDYIKKSIVMKNIKPCVTNAIDSKITLKNKDTKFVEKRSKLESVLGHLKKRIFADIEVGNENTTLMIKNDEQYTRRESIGDELSDISINEEEVLRDLENIDIPIEKDENKQENVINDKSDNYLDPNKEFGPKKPGGNVNVDIVRKENKNNTVVPKNLPPLQRFPIKIKKAIESPQSMKSVISDTEELITSDMDSISDTNIRFLIDDEDVDIDLKESFTEINKISCENNTGNIKMKSDKCFLDQNSECGDKMELITVYKIMSNNDEICQQSNVSSENLPTKLFNNEDMNVKSKSDNNGLNMFFKKCKKYRNRSKNNGHNFAEDDKIILNDNDNKKETGSNSSKVPDKDKTCQKVVNGKSRKNNKLRIDPCHGEIKSDDVEIEQTLNSLCNFSANLKATNYMPA